MKFDISRFRPCRDGKVFYDSCTSFRNMWETCQRGDWLLWVSKKLNVNNRVLTLAKGKCAQTVIHHMQDERSKKAVRAAVDYGNGLIDEEQLYAAADAAADYATYAASAAVYASYATAYAAYAAASAADAASHASSAASHAASAAYAASDADAYAAYAAAGADAADAYALKENQITAANICRETLTNEVFRILNGDELTI